MEGLDFSVAAFTNLTQDHLDYHHTMEEYRSAKERLFHQCRRAVLNLDDEAGRWYRERLACPVFTYSENKDQADLTAKGIRLYPGQVEFEAVAREQIQRVFLPIPGGFTIYNALCALSVGLCLGLRLSECAAALRSARGVKRESGGSSRTHRLYGAHRLRPQSQRPGKISCLRPGILPPEGSSACLAAAATGTAPAAYYGRRGEGTG